jgi:hypothetical protein
MGEGANVGLLNHVLRLGIIVEDAAGHAVEPTVVPLHDEPNGGPILVSGSFNQGRVIESIQRCRRDRCRLHGQAPVFAY